MTRRGMVLLIGLPAVLLVVTTALVWHVADTFHPASLRWTVIAAVLTAAAFLVAVLGVPIAVFQLIDLDRRLTRPNAQMKALNQFRIEASPWVQTLHQSQGAVGHEQYGSWVERVAMYVHEHMDAAEEATFRNAGYPGQPVDQLRGKLEYIRNDLIPKVRAGYW
jgi:hypothetical protein